MGIVQDCKTIKLHHLNHRLIKSLPASFQFPALQRFQLTCYLSRSHQLSQVIISKIHAKTEQYLSVLFYGQ